MNITFLEHEEKDTLATPKNLTSTSPLPLPLDENPASPVLFFEWQTDDDDRLAWQGDIDAVLGLPEGTFPHTFSAWIDILHPDDRDDVLNAIEAHLLSDAPYSIECRACRPDGTVLYWTYSGQARRDSNGEPIALVCTLRDIVSSPHGSNGFHPLVLPQCQNHAEANDDLPIVGETGESVVVALEEVTPVASAPKNAAPQEQEVDAAEQRAQSLLRAAAHLNAQLGLQDVCEAICEEAARTIGAPSAVMLFNKVRDAFVPTTVRDMPADYDKRYIPTPRYVYDGHVAAMGTLFLFTDAQATPDLPNHKLYTEVNMRTIGIASLIREGEVLGLLKVYSFGESRTFTANELALLQGLADIAAQAIANARLLAESQRRLANLGALRAIDNAILGSSDVNLALGVVLDQVVSRLDSDASSALLLDPHTRTLRYAVGRGFRTSTPRRTDWQLGEGLAGRAALERRVIHAPDLSRPDFIAADFTDPDLKLPEVHPDLATSGVVNHDANTEGQLPVFNPSFRRTGIPTNEGFASYYGLPLIANGKVQGVLEVWHRSPLHLDEEDLEFLETLAGQAAIAVDNAILFRDLQRSNDELVLAYDSTLAGWSAALDLRDKETEGHSERVTREALRLAREMGITDGELVHVRRGALLHDIGKVGVPDSILLKPGPLSDEEWVVMKKHPTYAFELLSPIQYLRPSLDIPYAHHEKWDGSGYPRGLSGEQIPLTARLFAVVDVWDALCSDRPYRKGWPIERVLNHIKEGSGSHFDPAVVQAFLRLHEHELPEPILPEPILPEPVLPETLASEQLPPELPAVPAPIVDTAPETKSPLRDSWLVRGFKTIWGAGDDSA